MHGRVKVKSTAQQLEEKRLEREKKMKMYKKAMSLIFKKRAEGELDDELLQITAGVLHGNPDDATLWNIRREVFLKYKEEGKSVNDRTKDELYLTQMALMKNPKSYGAWWHRGWVNQNLPDTPDWNNELKLCSVFLDKDDRNFHCWDYRRYICKHCDVSLEEELKFSRDRIDSNFSNYSSWHYRSHLLPRVFPGNKDKGECIQEPVLLEELDLVINAAFTDPYDQSAWMYHRWLLGRANPESDLIYARWYPDFGEVFVTFSSSIPSCSLVVTAVDTQLSDWAPMSDPKSSELWMLCGEKLMSVSELKISGSGNDITLTRDNPTWTVTKSSGDSSLSLFQKEVSAAKNDVLAEQLSNVDQLVEMEPDCKWPVLTRAMLMQALDSKKYLEDISATFSKLKKIDSKRSNYYDDLKSKFTLEAILEDKLGKDEVDLSSLELTCLRHMHLISNAQSLNLSRNQLKSENLNSLKVCPHLKSLDLSGNTLIIDLNFVKVLTRIQRLVLRDCANLTDLTALGGVTSLRELVISKNMADSLCETISKLCPQVKTEIV